MADYRPDFDDALQWVDDVWDQPLLLRECRDTAVERRLIHGSTKARDFAMSDARSTSPSGRLQWRVPLYSLPGMLKDGRRLAPACSTADRLILESWSGKL